MMLPMVAVWQLAEARGISAMGTTIPARAPVRFDAGLIWGSALFGVGWGLAGLCPGPALASISFGGTGGVVFLLAMLAGMLAYLACARACPAFRKEPPWISAR